MIVCSKVVQYVHANVRIASLLVYQYVGQFISGEKCSKSCSLCALVLTTLTACTSEL